MGGEGSGPRASVDRNPDRPKTCNCERPLTDGNHCVMCGKPRVIARTVFDQAQPYIRAVWGPDE